MNKILDLKNIRSGYRGEDIINGISFSVFEGDFIALLGANGSGKTTLVRTILNLCDVREGEICFRDKDLLDMKRMSIARYISVVPQTFNVVYDFSVQEFIEFGVYKGLGNFFGDSYEFSEHIDFVIKLLSLEDLTRRSVRALSSGEFQRVLIAQALAGKPELLILDEPISHLDIRYQYEIMDILKSLNREGLTIISVMHDMNISQLYFEKIIFIKNGNIIDFGATKDVFNNENIMKTYNLKKEILSYVKS